jgi:hypothetical protein
MRVWKGVYCNEEHESDVNTALHRLYVQLKRDHPEWAFDVDGPSWERCKDYEEDEEETDGA